MPRSLIELSKILPVTLEKVKKYIRCTKLWEAMSPIPNFKYEFIDENSIHMDFSYTFIIGLTGLVQHTAHIVQDAHFEEKGNTYFIRLEKSNEVAKSESHIVIDDLGDKIDVKVFIDVLYLQSGVLELVGRQIVINRFRGELRKLLDKTAKKLRDGSMEAVFAECDKELAEKQAKK